MLHVSRKKWGTAESGVRRAIRESDVRHAIRQQRHDQRMTEWPNDQWREWPPWRPPSPFNQQSSSKYDYYYSCLSFVWKRMSMVFRLLLVACCSYWNCSSLVYGLRWIAVSSVTTFGRKFGAKDEPEAFSFSLKNNTKVEVGKEDGLVKLLLPVTLLHVHRISSFRNIITECEGRKEHFRDPCLFAS